MTTTYAATYPEALAIERAYREQHPFGETEIRNAYGLGYNVECETRCHECGARLNVDELPPIGDELAEVYLDPSTLRANAGGQDVLVDDIPESAFGPFLVHADPCSRVEEAGRPKYALA